MKPQKERKVVIAVLFVISFGLLSKKQDRSILSVLLLSFSINLLAFYHKCCALIGYATHYLFCDR